MFSRDPSLGAFEVLAICGTTRYNSKVVLHLKYGDWYWSRSPNIDFVTLSFYRSWIFGLSHDGGIWSLDIDPSSKAIKISDLNIAVPSPEDWGALKYNIDFVVSTSYDLLLVHSHLRIQKLMIHSNGRLELIPVADLGGDSLFLGINQGISISASKYPICKPNFLYYARSSFSGKRKIVAINLEDESTREFHCGLYFSTWFLPSMNLFVRSFIF